MSEFPPGTVARGHSEQEKPILSILNAYLTNTVAMYPPSRTGHARVLLDMNMRNDPNALQYLIDHKSDDFLKPYAEKRLLELLTAEYRSDFTSDEQCKNGLQLLLNCTTNEGIRNCLDKCIRFLDLPEDTPLTVDIVPLTEIYDHFDDMLEEFEENPELLEKCIRYIKNACIPRD